MTIADELAAAYRVERAAASRVLDQSMRDELRTIGGVRTGQALARRNGALQVLEAVARECDEAVGRLIDAHLRAGERDASAVASRIRGEFIEQVLRTPPGIALLHGAGQDGPFLARTAGDLRAKFEMKRGVLSRAIEDRFLVARSKLGSEEAKNVKSNAPSIWAPSGYRILELIGTGGFSKVYAARHLDSDDVVALKIMDDDPEARRRAERELEALSQLRHSNIIEVLEAASDGSWYAMPRAETTLGRVADIARPAGAELRAVVEQVASALEHAHTAGAIHRDISPDNILRVDGCWLLADWGMVRLPPALARSAMTRSGLGTMPWASPEVISDPTAADCRADIFSLGRIVGWLVSGVVPEVNRPSVVPPGSEWFDFVRAATAWAREQRPSTIAELLSLMPAEAQRAEAEVETVTDVPCDVLWTLHLHQGSVTDLGVGYQAGGPETLRKALTTGVPNVRREDLPLIAQRAADQLAQHALMVMPDPVHYREGELVLVPERTSEHLTHYVTSSFGGAPQQPAVLTWSREMHFPGDGYEARTGDVLIAELEVSLRECVIALDQLAIKLAAATIEKLRQQRLSPRR